MSPYRCFNPECRGGSCPNCRYVRDLERRAAGLAQDTERRRVRGEAAVLGALDTVAFRTKAEISRAARLSDRGVAQALVRLAARGLVESAEETRTHAGPRCYDGEPSTVSYRATVYRLARRASDRGGIRTSSPHEVAAGVTILQNA